MAFRTLLFALTVSALAALFCTPAGAADSKAQARFFEEHIRPVLVDRCYGCHSVEKGKHKGGLLVDSRDALLKGGATGPAVIPGDPDKSLIVKAIKQLSDEMKMPPEDRLTPSQIADFEQWVKDGAFDPRTQANPPAKTAALGSEPGIDWQQARTFWSYKPLALSSPPTVRNETWCRTPIDSFILAKLDEKKLAPATDASKRTLLRRATFDLIGLPPSPEESDAFVADTSPTAFEKVINRLLASPHYGERWGRHWLDVARYADTEGDSADYPIPQAIKYRDYVIDALNADMPYDQFLREQIAGDVMPAKDDAEHYRKIVATGFVALSRRFSVVPENEMHLTIDDTLDTMGRCMLGMTLSCARCHDHKFDPITMKDYYALYGFFSSSKFPFPGSENNHRPHDLVPLASQQQADALIKPFEATYAKMIAEGKQLDKERAELNKLPDAQDKWNKLGANWKLVQKADNERKEFYSHPPPVDYAYAITEGMPKNERVHRRGESGNQGDEVPRRFIEVLGGQALPAGAKDSGRLQLADWIADPKNPLTARVMANRIWQHHFEKGIVASPSDFGKQGKPPTHPELLDFLANQFVQNGWSIKSLHKQIMLSHVYQLSSESADPASAATIDPVNDFLSHATRHRLDAEAIRDAMLFVAGNLDTARGGPHPFPPPHTWAYSQHDQFNAVYPSDKRSVYLMQQRLKKHPFLALFDGADTNATTAVRASTTTPIQALFMMNDPFTHEQGEVFAAHLIGEESDDSNRVRRAFRTAFGREASDADIARSRDFIAKYLERAKGTLFPPSDYEQLAWGALCRVLLSSNEFLFVE